MKYCFRFFYISPSAEAKSNTEKAIRCNVSLAMMSVTVFIYLYLTVIFSFHTNSRLRA